MRRVILCYRRSFLCADASDAQEHMGEDIAGGEVFGFVVEGVEGGVGGHVTDVGLGVAEVFLEAHVAVAFDMFGGD